VTLANEIIADAALFLTTDDFGVATTYKALGTGTNTSVNAVFSEGDQGILEIHDAEYRSREASVSVPAVTVTDPARTDTYTVASGPFTGLWVCTHVELRDAGLVTVRCRLETIANTVAKDAHEVRP
jgi:hypothetical protein